MSNEIAPESEEQEDFTSATQNHPCSSSNPLNNCKSVGNEMPTKVLSVLQRLQNASAEMGKARIITASPDLKRNYYWP